MRFAVPLLFATHVIAACGGSTASVAPATPDSGFTPIHRVQGSGAQSPLAGERVRVVGIVTGDVQDGDADPQNSLGGFFLQEERPDADGRSSEGIFVFDDALGVDVQVGDRVAAAGRVEEFFGETQLRASSVRIVGSGSIAPTDLSLPAATAVRNGDGVEIAGLERYEGMLVRFPQVLTVVDAFDLERFGSLTLAAGGRTFQFTNERRPDPGEYALHRNLVARSSIVLDDGSDERNKTPPRYLFPGADAAQRTLRLGDRVSALTGTLRYSRGSGSAGTETFRVIPVGEPAIVPGNTRPAIAPSVGGDLRVVSFNTLNFFSTVDSGQRVCGPLGTAACRGADTAAEFERQLKKLTAAILAADADIVGLMEIENTSSASQRAIVEALNVNAGRGRWRFVDTGPIGTDAIRVGFVFDASSVETVGGFAVLDSTVDARFNDAKNRPALAQSFASVANGGVVTIAVNHLKSKGSSCDDVGDPDRSDGQGNCNRTRARAAAALADWLAGDPTGSGDGDVLIIGDLNAYLRADPLQALIDAGYENLLDTFVGPEAYSFVFRGEAGALDHALASRSLAPQVTGVAEWHINADEPPVLDYNLDANRAPGIFDPSEPFRASDHDPVVIGLSLIP